MKDPREIARVCIQESFLVLLHEHLRGTVTEDELLDGAAAIFPAANALAADLRVEPGFEASKFERARQQRRSK